MIAACRCTKEAVLDSEVFYLLVGFQHLIMCREQAVMETLNDCHRQDNQSVFVRLIGTKEGIRHIPNQIRLFLNIDSNRLNFIVRVHSLLPP